MFDTIHGVSQNLERTDGSGVQTEGERTELCNGKVEAAQRLMLDVDKRSRMRYPGTFLYKKAEKRGLEKKRFFQLEPPPTATDVDGSAPKECQFVYYTGVPPAEKKGAIDINSTTEIMTRGKEIMIKNTDRKWILSAKTAEEAAWWRDLLSNSRSGLPPAVTQVPYCNLVSDLVSAASFRQNVAAPNTHSPPTSAPGHQKAGRATPERDGAATPPPHAGITTPVPVPVPAPVQGGAGGNGPDVDDAPEDWDLPEAPAAHAAVASMLPTHVVIADYANDTGEGSLSLKRGDEVVVTDMGEDGGDSEWWYTELDGSDGGKMAGL